MPVYYDHRSIEEKWRKEWEEHPVNVDDGKKEKYYCLYMFPHSCFYEVRLHLEQSALYQLHLLFLVLPLL